MKQAKLVLAIPLLLSLAANSTCVIDTDEDDDDDDDEKPMMQQQEKVDGAGTR